MKKIELYVVLFIGLLLYYILPYYSVFAQEEKLPFYNKGIQLKKEHISAVVDKIKKIPNCRLLIWGTGHDSKLWCEVNKTGTTIITEDVQKWADLAIKKFKELGDVQDRCKVVMIKYNTRRKQARDLLGKKDLLKLDLPIHVTEKFFDVIVIDGPKGFNDATPGRMQSIFMSSLISHDKSHIFVDDYYRFVERQYSKKYLFPKFGAPLILKGRAGFAHYSNSN